MTRPSRHRQRAEHPLDDGRARELWPLLARNQHVALVNERGWRLSGRVETVTNDRQCLWIQLDAGMGRQLIHHEDGFVLEEEPRVPPGR